MQPDHWDLRILSRVEADSVNDRTRVEWDVGLGSAQWHVTPANPPQPFALRKRLDVFGHNAPLQAPRSTIRHRRRLDVRALRPRRTVRRPRRLASRRHARLVGRPLEADVPRALQGRVGRRAVARRLRRLGEHHAARALASARTTASSSRAPCARRPCSRCRRRSTSPRRPTRRPSTRIRSASTWTSSQMRPGRRLIVRGTTTGGADAVDDAVVKDGRGRRRSR